MQQYSEAAVERAMKVQEVMLRAFAKKITWMQAAEIIGVSDCPRRVMSGVRPDPCVAIDGVFGDEVKKRGGSA